MDPAQHEKYSRQILFGGIGEDGQQRLLDSSIVLVGCGAIGTVVSNLLVRAGVGRLRIIDRDFVETSNLQRQTLFEEADATETLPKAIAAQRRLSAINSDAKIEGIVSDLTPKNVRELLSGSQLILDGTDNFQTRLLMNDAAIALATPWIYTAAVGSYGVTMTIRPTQTACLACLLETDGTTTIQDGEDTCDTAGILNAAANFAASIEAAEALKILAGINENVGGRLFSGDVWTGTFQSIRVARNPECRACGSRNFAYLDGKAQGHITMCGRDSVQIHEKNRKIDLEDLKRRLSKASVGEIRNNEFLLQFRIPPYDMTVFVNGRAIIKGTTDASVARSLYARYIGA